VQDSLYMDTVHKFLSLYRYLRCHSRQMQQEGISGRKMSTLRYVLETGPRTIGQVRRYLYIGDSSTSELVASLEEKGYVTRTRSQEDNRVVIVELTPAGRELAQKKPLGGIPLLRERLRTLPPERLERINAAVTDVMDMLEVAYDG
jgi:DNA-binding MarR family transcriptional regulator